MVSIKKRLVALIMTLVMALSLSATAFAAEPTNIIVKDPATASVSEETSTMSSLGDVIAGNFTTIYGGSGSLTVYLSKGNFFADIMAQIDYTDQNGIVTVSVLTPDGNTISMGDIVGSGSQTFAYELFYAPAGDYRFYFTSTITTPYQVSAFIYD